LLSKGEISVLLSNVYLHYVLDICFERVVKVRLRGEARVVRYIDDFVICFQYRSDAIRVQDALRLRLGKFGSLSSRPRPSWLSLVGSRSDTQASAVENARRHPLLGHDAVLRAKPEG
jgi:RNA-directed DNA polymerase